MFTLWNLWSDQIKWAQWHSEKKHKQTRKGLGSSSWSRTCLWKSVVLWILDGWQELGLKCRPLVHQWLEVSCYSCGKSSIWDELGSPTYNPRKNLQLVNQETHHPVGSPVGFSHWTPGHPALKPRCAHTPLPGWQYAAGEASISVGYEWDINGDVQSKNAALICFNFV